MVIYKKLNHTIGAVVRTGWCYLTSVVNTGVDMLIIQEMKAFTYSFETEQYILTMGLLERQSPDFFLSVCVYLALFVCVSLFVCLSGICLPTIGCLSPACLYVYSLSVSFLFTVCILSSVCMSAI